MGEDRRLNIAKRQLMLAQIARREARYGLANALAEEERSEHIHDRSRALLDEYAKRITGKAAGSISQSLKANLAFVRSLQQMADDARGAHKDARDQAEWQIRALATAEARMDTHQTRVKDEARKLSDLRARRDVAPELTGSAGMARKLHKGKRPV